MQADLADPGAALRLFDQAESRLGPLDILVNNAGVVAGDQIADTTDDVFDTSLAVNLKSPFVLIREAARRLRDGGRVINISTLNTVMVGPGMAPNPEESRKSLTALTALGRIGQPGDVADVVAFLVSDDARWLTGQCIRAAGGLLA